MNISNVYTAGQSVVEDGETWKVCNELPPNYQFSNTGRIRKFISGTDFVFIEPSVKGYPTVSINGRQHPFHRIIASLFIEVKQGDSSALVVVHKDGNISNNSASNLEWSTSGNVRKHSIDLSKKWIICREQHKLYNSTISADYALNIPREAIADAVKTGNPVCGLHFILDTPDSSYTEDDAVYLTTSAIKKLALDSESLDQYREAVDSFR